MFTSHVVAQRSGCSVLSCHGLPFSDDTDPIDLKQPGPKKRAHGVAVPTDPAEGRARRLSPWQKRNFLPLPHGRADKRLACILVGDHAITSAVAVLPQQLHMTLKVGPVWMKKRSSPGTGSSG